jgi:hypothetical protein
VEKAIARKAFDRALGGSWGAVILETKSKAAKTQETSGLWELVRHLTQRHQQIDRKYDYRCSILPLVLANLLNGSRSTRTSCTAWAKTNSATSIAQLCTFKPSH